MEFNFTYKKASNKELLNHLEQNDNLEISKLQNYIPLYEKFFNLNENNFKYKWNSHLHIKKLQIKIYLVN